MATGAEISALYQQYGPVVHRRCRALLGDEQEAWDVTQEAFIRLIRHADGLRGEASPMTWLYRVTTNLCLNRLRDQRGRRQRLQLRAQESAPPGQSQPHQPDPDVQQLVLSLLSRVDNTTRAVVIYYFLDELTLEEIEGLVDLSVPTIRKRIQHFQALSRKHIARELAMVGFLLVVLPAAWNQTETNEAGASVSSPTGQRSGLEGAHS